MPAATTELRNRVWYLARYPVGHARAEDFELRDEPAPRPGPGEILLRLSHLSVDPGQRVYMNPTVDLHEKSGGSVSAQSPLNGWGIGQVIESDDPRFPVGSWARDLYGDAGVRHYCALPPEKLIPVDLDAAPAPAHLSLLGMPGLTAYFGLLHVGDPKPGETVVISAASGGVGSIAGQIARIKGCRVVGIVGSEAKRRYLIDELGFDDAIDRTAGDLDAALRAACPDGIDIYFDNVGGDILDACLGQMRMFGRIVFCGATLVYNATGPVVGPSNYYNVLLYALRWQGFSVPYYDHLFGAALAEMTQWIKDGALRCRYDVSDGIESFPDALAKLFEARNFGKVLIKLD